MTKQERIIISAYTGFLMCDFQDVHNYIEAKLGRPLWTHELGYETTRKDIMLACKDDFLALCSNE